MSSYRTAIDLTTRTVERRARNFRNQIVATVILGLVSIVWALIARSPAPLAGLICLVPISGLFLVADTRELDVWRSALLQSWVDCELDISAFSAAVRANPALPKETSDGMLATLPSAGGLIEEQRMAKAARAAIAAKTLMGYRWASDILGLKAACWGFVAAVAIVTVILRQWQPLIALTGLIFVPIVKRWLRRRRFAVPKAW